MPNRQTTASLPEAHRTPAVSPTPQPSHIDPVQRTWDAAGHTNRTILLHTFGIPCHLAANAWDELNYTVQIVIRSHFQRLIKRGQVPVC